MQHFKQKLFEVIDFIFKIMYNLEEVNYEICHNILFSKFSIIKGCDFMKKTITIFLSAILLLSIIQTMNVFAENTGAVPDSWNLLQQTIQNTILPPGQTYSEDTLNAYLDARNYAISLDKTAPDEELKNAKKALETAFLNLKPASVKKDDLWKAIKKLQNTIYFKSFGYKYRDVDNMLKSGKSIYYTSNSQEKIDEVTMEMEQFIETLSKKMYLSAGDSKKCYVVYDKVKKWKSSNKKIAIIKDNKVIALTKGTVNITAKLKNGDKLTTKLRVKNNPTLTKKGKNIKTISVKKGKTVTVRLSGKAIGVNNSYRNTKNAIVISKKSARVIKIMGIKNGNTILKITVNGKTLKLKIKVI